MFAAACDGKTREGLLIIYFFSLFHYYYDHKVWRVRHRFLFTTSVLLGDIVCKIFTLFPGFFFIYLFIIKGGRTRKESFLFLRREVSAAVSKLNKVPLCILFNFFLVSFLYSFAFVFASNYCILCIRQWMQLSFVSTRKLSCVVDSLLMLYQLYVSFDSCWVLCCIKYLIWNDWIIKYVTFMTKSWSRA